MGSVTTPLLCVTKSTISFSAARLTSLNFRSLRGSMAKSNKMQHCCIFWMKSCSLSFGGASENNDTKLLDVHTDPFSEGLIGFKVMAHSGYLVNFNHPFLEKLSVCLFNLYIGNTTASLQIRFCNKRTLFSKFSMNNLKSLLKLWCICNITSCSRKCLNKNYGYPVPDQESQNHDPLAGTYPYRFCERVHTPPPAPRTST